MEELCASADDEAEAIKRAQRLGDRKLRHRRKRVIISAGGLGYPTPNNTRAGGIPLKFDRCATAFRKAFAAFRGTADRARPATFSSSSSASRGTDPADD